ncbi:putative outer membrane repeat protein, partial [Mesonia hippocampi]
MKKNTFLFFFFLLFSFSPNVLSQTVNLFFSDFENASSAWTKGSLLGENKWEIDECAGNGPSVTGTASAYITDGAISACGYTYTYLNSSSINHSITLSREVNTYGGTNLLLTFDYNIGGNSGDYGEVVYKTSGGASWNLVPGSNLTSSGGWSSMSISLPSSLDGTTFDLGFRYTYDNSIINLPGLAVDNVKLEAIVPTCPTGNVIFSSQAEIDSFASIFPNCTTISENMSISGNNITNLNGLSNIEDINGTLGISLNPLLQNLDGLSSLQSVSTVHIGNNNILTDVSGLENIDATMITNLGIINNPQLATCNNTAFCTYLSDPSNFRVITGNAVGCESNIAVIKACDIINPSTNNILYVDINADTSTSNLSGDSWANAIPELADALKWARTMHNADNNWLQNDSLQIYVAKGTYKPLYSAEDGNYTTNGNRDNSFVMVKNVQLYGGFDPDNGITNLTHQRIAPATTQGTILNGDLNGDDGNNVINIFDNAYHVLISADDVGNALLDGFTLTGGNAHKNTDMQVNGRSVYRHLGGGIINRYSSPTLTNIIITENRGNYGAGIYNNTSSPNLTNVTIAKNIAHKDGGGMYNYYSYPDLTHIIFSENTSNRNGGGIYTTNSSPSLINVTLVGNTATDEGGGIYNNLSSWPELYNTVLYANTPTDIHDVSPLAAVSTNNFSETSYTIGNSFTQLVTNPFVNSTNSIGNDGIWGTQDDGLYPINTSLLINAGDNNANTETTDIVGNSRVFADIIDVGAYESQITPITPDTNNIIYVDINADTNTSNFSGDSWANAIPELADALLWARVQNHANNAVFDSQVLQIYVAKGTYKPLYNAADGNYTTNGNRDNAFVMVKNVQLYGGFDPDNGITNLTHQRITPSTTQGTILSGDLNNDDGANFTNNGENTHHILISVNDIGNAILDGFTITGANANKSSNIAVYGTNVFGSEGAGVFVQNSSSPKLINVNITKNKADVSGGGIRIGDLSTPNLTNVNITENTAGSFGGGMRIGNSSPTLINVRITGNIAGNQGGGIFNGSGYATLMNTTIAENSPSAIHAGGWTYWDNTIVWGGITRPGSSTTYTTQNCLIEGSSNTNNGNISAIGVHTTDVFTDPFNGDFTLKDGSPAIDMGSNQLYWGAIGNGAPVPPLNDNRWGTDLAGDMRISGISIDIGAFEGESQMVPLIPDTNNIIYVDINADTTTSNLNGNSWTNAVPELADALFWARIVKDPTWATTPLQIWVAAGTYKPGTLESSSFKIPSNVTVLGGFSATETNADERNWTTNPTILSGDLDNSASSNSGDAHSIVSFLNDDNAVLDGFIIEYGYADGTAVIDRTGAGIYINNATSIRINNAIIRYNTAYGNANDGVGGGLVSFGEATLTNCLFYENTASANGGAISAENGTINLVNSTITNNTAQKGGGVHFYGGDIEAVNSIFTQNSGTNGNMNDDSGINAGTANVSYSLFYNSTTGNNGNLPPHIVDGGNNIYNTDPLYKTGYRLLDYSPAIDIGNNTAYTNAGGDINNDKDLAGKSRLYNNIIDIGAFESEYLILQPDTNNIIYVDKNVDTNTSNQNANSWANAIPELADALKWTRIQQNADSSVFDSQPLQIYVAKGTYKPLYNAEDGKYSVNGNRDNAFVMVKNVQLYGGFDPANNITDLTHTRDFSETTGTILNGDFNNDDVVTGSGASLSFSNTTENTYHVVISANDVGNALLDGFSLTGGSANGSNDITVNGQAIFKHLGGGMYNSNSSPSLTNVNIVNNTADGNGGGMYNENSSTNLTNVKIESNTANYGGGIYNENSSPSLTNVNIIKNNSTYRGGGIFNMSGYATLTNTTIVGNSPNAIYAYGWTFWNNSIVWGSIDGSNYTAKHSLIQGNSNTSNGNIDATGLSETDIFTDPVNGDYSLKDGSLAIDAGSNSLYTGDINNDTDLAGNTRLFGSTIDIGAFEHHGIKTYWTGNINTDWHTAGNWTSGLPSTTSNAVIDQVTNQPLVAATSSAEAYSIVINPGASLSVLGELSFQTSLTNHGDLLFLSNANATGQLAELPEGASITGNPAEVQRYIPSGTRAFRFLSSAVNSTDNIHTNWQEGALNNTDNPTPSFGTHITGDATGLNGFDATPSGNASLFDFDNATQTWNSITNTDVNTLTIGKAYRLYVRGDRSIDVTSNAATPTATTLRAKGSLHTGNFSLSNLSGTAGGFNFVGNPYQ